MSMRRDEADPATRRMRGDQHREMGFHSQSILNGMPRGVTYSPLFRRRRPRDDR